ncbi:MAG: hypothetical protein E4G94_06505 [ANME-2 cluster archaeon]|nr:MAG: hypothetical protein E4G94_06505 [ANME-2 cluster archaeon]
MSMKLFSKPLAFGIALIIFLGIIIVPASAANDLEEIDEWVCDFANGDYPNMTRFMALNMEDQGPDLIAVEIIKNPAFSFLKKKPDVIRTYYVEKVGDGVEISSPDFVVTSNCVHIDNLGEIEPNWTFRPTIRETQRGIDILIFCETCMQHKRTKLVSNVWKMLRLWISVEKEEVPTVDDLILNSSWLGRFLPNWL